MSRRGHTLVLALAAVVVVLACGAGALVLAGGFGTVAGDCCEFDEYHHPHKATTSPAAPSTAPRVTTSPLIPAAPSTGPARTTTRPKATTTRRRT